MMARLRLWFNDRPIRYKLLATHWFVCALFLSAGGLGTYSLVRSAVERHIESELRNSTSSVLNLVKSSVVASTRNYLRAVADRNLELVKSEYERFRSGNATEAEAKARAAELLLHQRIARTGYLVCLDSQGVMRVHPSPELRDKDLSSYAFVRRLRTQKTGYFEYDWENPGEKAARPKAAYMAYFAPWDWIIMASSYRDEFADLVNVEDLRRSVLGLRLGGSGYCFLIDTTGNLILHPKMEGQNVARLGADTELFQAMLREPSGKRLYTWRNPDEAAPRRKLVFYDRIPEYGWIVASTVYLDEIYAPLRQLRTLFILTLLASLALAFPVALWLASSITNPLQEVRAGFARAAGGDLSCRMRARRRDEVGQLAGYFDAFMDKLEAYSGGLKAEIAEREQAEAALRLSEEKFAKAFRSSPSGIAILRVRDRRFVDGNQAFGGLLGLPREELLERTPEDLEGLFGLGPEVDGRGHVAGRAVTFRTRSGEQRQGQVSVEEIAVGGEPCLLVTLDDMTEWRRLEREVVEAGDRERGRIGQELHDDLAPHLIGIEALSKVLARKLGEGASAGARQAEQIRSLIAEAIQKTRALARGLSPVHLEDRGLAVALQELAETVSAIFEIDCRVEADEAVEIRDNTVATQLYYLASEAIHNAVKHAKPGLIRVELDCLGDRVRLQVIDDGQGFRVEAPSGGMGLRLLAHRAAMIGADLAIRSRPGEGTCICATAAVDVGVEVKA